jgi:hypothetical protein
MCTAHSRQVKVSRRRHCALPDYMHKIVLFSGETFPDRFYLPIARDDDSRAARVSFPMLIYVLLYVYVKRATRAADLRLAAQKSIVQLLRLQITIITYF